MSSRPIVVSIAGDDAQLNAILAKALANIKTFQGGAEGAGHGMTKSFGEARGAAALLGEEVGIKLNRHLRSVLASSELIGPLLNAAFPIAAAIGFAEVAERIPDAIRDAADAVGGFTEKVKAANEEAIKNNEKILTSFNDIAKGYLILQELQKDQVKASDSSSNTNIFSGLGKAYAGGGIIGMGLQIRQNIQDRNKLTEQSLNLSDLEMKVHERLADLYKERTKEAEEYAKKVADARAAWVGTLDAAEKASGALLNKGDPFAEQLQAIDEQLTKWREIRSEQYGINAIANQYVEQLQKQRDAVIDQQKARQATLTDPLQFGQFLGQQKIPNLIGQSDIDGQRMLQQQKDIQGWIDATETSAEKYADALKDLNALFSDKSSDIYLRALQQIKDQYDETNKAVQAFGEGIGKALQQGVLMGRGWKDVLDSILVSLVQLIAKLYIVKALQSSSFGSGGGFGGFITALVSGFAGKASGGPVSGGVPYMVGENGPELFLPKSSGSIVPNGKWGGGTVVYQIDARGAHPGAERDIMLALKQTEDNAVARAVSVVQQRGLRSIG